MMQINKQLTLSLLSTVLLSAGNLANAATWSFNNTNSNTQGGVTATASGWANTVGSSNTALESAFLTYNGSNGLGIKNKDCGISPCTGSGDTNEGSSPEHAVDNDQRKDSILFSFAGDKVNLNATNFGWVSQNTGYKDADYSVYAYTGLGVGSLTGLTYNDSALAGAGWSLVGHYEGGSAAGSKPITSNIFSSYWLIGAVNGTGDTKKDAFKLISVAGGTCTANPNGAGCGGGSTSVPEPGTLLLMGIGLFGLSRVRRSRPAR